MTLASTIVYYLADHPAIVNFRWSDSAAFGSTWVFLVSSLSLYLLLSLLLSLLLDYCKIDRPVPLGPIPAVHSFLMSLSSALIFTGLLLSSLLEIRQSLWLFRGRTATTPLRWLLCFPPGTRPSGRVFFWSYLFYLSRLLLHSLRPAISLLRRRPHALSRRVLPHLALVATSFLWLQFSQSFQVPAILAATAAQAVVYGYRFWAGLGLPVFGGPGGGGGGCFPVVLACQVGLLGCNLAFHLGFLMLHFFWRGGCSGAGAWLFNSVLNAGLLVVFLDCHVRRAVMRRRGVAVEGDDCGSLHHDHRRDYHHDHHDHQQCTDDSNNCSKDE